MDRHAEKTTYNLLTLRELLAPPTVATWSSYRQSKVRAMDKKQSRPAVAPTTP
jgi:hypothetical protein